MSGNISVMPRVSYQTGNNSLVVYDKSKFLPVPVATNRILAPSLITSGALVTVPLLVWDGAVSQVQSTLIPKANVNNVEKLYTLKKDNKSI